MELLKKINQLIKISVIILLIASCKQKDFDKRIFSENLGLFNLKRTDFFYRKNPIYSMDIPYPFLHSSFSTSNYLLVENDRVSEILLFDNCIQEYKNKNYKISYALPNKLSVNCDIQIIPLIDFSLKEGEYLRYYKDHWVRLEKKEFDRKANDTLYVFCRKWGNGEYNTYIGASKRRGFLLVYDAASLADSSSMQAPIGKFVSNVKGLENYKIKQPSIDLSLIDEFKKYR